MQPLHALLAPALPALQSDALPPAVLFLDFDGVLQTPALDDWREMEHCALLEALLMEFPELNVVVTSTHRELRTVADVQGLLPDAVGRRVVGLTDVPAMGRANGGRQAEIEAWLRSHPSVQRWVAVDDERRLYREGCPWLVLTHPYVGWDEQTSDAVRRLASIERVPNRF